MNRRNFFGTVGAVIAGMVMGSKVEAAGAGGNVTFLSASDGRWLTLEPSSGFRLFDSAEFVTWDRRGLVIENDPSADATLRFVDNGNVRFGASTPNGKLHIYEHGVLPDGNCLDFDWYGAWL